MKKETFVWEMAQRIFAATISSGFGKYIWLLSPSSLDVTQPAHRLDWGLVLAYCPDEKKSADSAAGPGTPMNEEWSRYFLNFLKKELLLQEQPIMVDGERKLEPGRLTIRLRTEREGVYVPLTLHILNIQGERMRPESLVMNLCFAPGQKLGYFRYPAEKRAATLVFHIMNELELISEMEPYLYLYELLRECAMDGRDAGEELRSRLHDSGLVADERHRQIFESYRYSRYMIKRWKVLMRRQRISSPSWEDVHKAVSGFILPVWEALESDTVFMGDWMPDLERFL